MDLCDILSELVNDCLLPESKPRETENGGKNLLCFHDDLIFMWDQCKMQILVIQMHFNADSKKKYHLERYICSQPPDCEISEIRYLAKRDCLLLIGNLSVTVVFCSLPRLHQLQNQKQKPDDLFMWRSCLISSTISNGNINVTIVSVIASGVESNLISILTSDNLTRFFDLNEPHCHSVHNFFIQSSMHSKTEGGRKRSIGRSIMGENAIAIDFIPTDPAKDSTNTFDAVSTVNSEFLVALLESGDVLLYIILYDRNFGVKNYCLGYLRVFPSSNSSHILSAISMIVFCSTQSFIAISCSSGHIFHCLLLLPSSSYIQKSIEMHHKMLENQYNQSDRFMCLDPLAGLYVIERISIGSESIDDNDKDLINVEPNSFYLLPGRHPYSCYYYVRHNVNVYCIYVSWFEKMLLEYFENGEDYDSVFQNQSMMSTLVENPHHHHHLQLNHVVGVCSVFHSLVGIFSLVLLNTGKLSVFSNIVPFLESDNECDTDSKSLANNGERLSLPVSEQNVHKSTNFLQKIQRILATRQRNLPLIIGSGDTNSSFDLKSSYSEVLDIIFTDYIKRCELVRCEIDKKMSFIEISIKNNADLLQKSIAASMELQENFKAAVQRSEEIESRLACSISQFVKLQGRIAHSFPASPEEIKLKDLCTSVRSQLNHVSDLIFKMKAKKKCIEMLNVTPTETPDKSSSSTVGLTRVPSRQIEESHGLSSSQLLSIRSHLEDNSRKIKKLLSDYEKLKARADLK